MTTTTTRTSHTARLYEAREAHVRKLVGDSQKFNDAPTYDALFDYLNQNRRGYIGKLTPRKLLLQHEAHLLRVLAEAQRRVALSLTFWLGN